MCACPKRWMVRGAGWLEVGAHCFFGTILPSLLDRHSLMLMWEVNRAAPMARAPLGSGEHSPDTWSLLPFWSRLYAEQKSEKPFIRIGKLVILRVVAAAAQPETAMVLMIRRLKVCIFFFSLGKKRKKRM